jgi:hypothetical protein
VLRIVHSDNGGSGVDAPVEQQCLQMQNLMGGISRVAADADDSAELRLGVLAGARFEKHHNPPREGTRPILSFELPLSSEKPGFHPISRFTRVP